MHDHLKTAVGIEVANCSSCSQLGCESDGEGGYGPIWYTCGKFKRYEHLKPFPFKTEQACWEPNFWKSKFSKLVGGSDESVDLAIDAFKEAKKSITDNKAKAN